mmetsp:Transcript_18042/g.43368  ORF Transcript_18042/g.43368 Transcript_18042/m.43368 type:complete len:202 (-) Transcript_18042:882-1487(-)
MLRGRHRHNSEISGGQTIRGTLRLLPSHRGHVPRRDLPPRQKAPFPRIPAHHRPPPSAHQHHRGGIPRPIDAGRGRARILPNRGFQLRPDPAHHRIRLRGGGRDVPRDDARHGRRGVAPPREGRGREGAARGGLRGGLFRQGGVLDGVGTAGGRDLRDRAGGRVHLRPDVPRGEFADRQAPGGVLDGRAGDGIRGPDLGHG